MLFTEPIFFLFFPVVLAGAWALGRFASSGRPRKLWLLAASYLFYAAWDWRFLSLIAASTLVDYGVGRALERTQASARRRAWLVVSLVLNLGLLGVFKYYGFFVESARGLLDALGIALDARVPEIVLPVGISFYTFQTLSYTIDVYRRRIEPLHSLPDFALFVSFFPQLVAGPIVRASDFLPQLDRRPRWADVAVRRALVLFLVGFVKKACIADGVAPVVDRVFAHPAIWTSSAVWTAVLLYAVQIYCDFSGYTDMAIACAELLGFRLEKNFDFPYIARSVTEFWRRWHISLSGWLRDYLYIPLGGNRGGRLATHRNLLITMLLGGLWHGAAWTFVVWGALHGVALALHKEWRRWRQGAVPGARRLTLPHLPAPLGVGLGWAVTFVWVCLAWIFFRAQSFADAAVLVRAFAWLPGPGTLDLPRAWLLLVVVLGVAHWVSAYGASAGISTSSGAEAVSGRALESVVERIPDWSFAAAYGSAVALTLLFLPLRSAPFIYFQF